MQKKTKRKNKAIDHPTTLLLIICTDCCFEIKGKLFLMGVCSIKVKTKQKDHSQIGSTAISICVCTFYFCTCSFVFSICILWLWPLANVTASLGGTQTSGTQCRLSLDIVCYSHVVACVKVLVTLTYNYFFGTNLPCLQSSWCSNGLLSLCCVVLLISKIKFETKIKWVSLPLLRANKQRKCGI